VPFLIPDGDDEEMVALIETWRYRGVPTTWADIIGHRPQIDRCRQVVELLRRDQRELDRLRLRRGRGMVISGPAGTGKTLLARATATAAGRSVVVPPTAELHESLIARLYAQLAKMDPTIVILDEAEAIIGHAYARTTDASALRALLAALDGMNRDKDGPLTIALTTVDPFSLDDAATRPGRLAPTLQLDPPTSDERRQLLERLIQGLPVTGDIVVEAVVARTARWTGAQLVGAVEEACARSLLDGTDALTQKLLLEVVSENFLVVDDPVAAPELTLATAVHEAAHAVFAEATWPGSVAAVEMTGRSGHTHLAEDVDRAATAEGLRELIAFALAGRVGEELILGRAGVGRDNNDDAVVATDHALSLLDMQLSYAPSVLEGSTRDTPQGSERMRAELHAAVTSVTDTARRDAVALLAPRIADMERLAKALLTADGAKLSGDAVRNVLESG
jgi:SpoVK/Ycf46/Vps4 family AAA+-type ATPase